ncbi:MmgE/PrpD family protein [Nocardioides marmoriginsengisoli]|uniref:MmgE/PrpD family protein n=1 Tax=Nocardioides marmoriginsengisoli TaxID=661483 RepID=UPI001610BAF6|nr:MmgE/PrpD family protein [Nocardioides marmoriginsengisoli]
MADILDTITTWAAGLSYEDLPAEVRERAAFALSDTIATMVGGAPTESAAIALDYAAVAAGPAPLVTRGTSTTPASAAFANGVAASALDFDDGHYLAGAIHPGSVVVPGMLAVADGSTTVAQALVAQVVGYEIGLRAAALLWPKHDGDHYHATGCAGAIGSAAAAAKLLGLDADGIARAIKIAWVHAPMSTFNTPMVKESIGWGASTGVAAAELARAGWMKVPAGYAIPSNEVLPPSPFHQPGAAEDPFVTSIGTTYEVMNTYFKSFGACRYTHAAGAGFAELLAEHGLKADDIASVRVGTHQAATFLDEVAPQTIETAQYSFPLVLGALALWGEVGAPEMAASSLDDPERLAFAAKVRLEHDADLDQHYPARYPSRVEVTTTDGRSVSGVYLDAPGDPGSSFGPDEMKAKWIRLLTPALGESGTASVLAGIADPTASLTSVLGPVWASR